MTSRLFTAVLPPPDVVAELDRYLEPRREAGEGTWRWSRPEGWHLTTAFMAEVSPQAEDQLVDGLRGVAERSPAFELGLGGAVCFPSVARAKLLAMAVSSGGEELSALATRCRGAATRAGANPDGARFVGHLTLARARRALDATRWAQVVGSFPGWRFRVAELVLVQSHLHDRGNRYEVLERLALRGPA